MTDRASLLERPPSGQTFRPIQYLGSKARIVDRIRETLDDVDPARGLAVDLFSGSGVVAANLARTRPVVAVDVQEYARVLAAALLSPARLEEEQIDSLETQAEEWSTEGESAVWPLVEFERTAIEALTEGEPEAFAAIVEGGSLTAHELTGSSGACGTVLDEALQGLRSSTFRATLTRLYGGVYFSYRQAIALDSILEVVHDLGDERLRDTCLAAALGAASESVTSVGSHFAQPVRARDKVGTIKSATLAAAAQRRGRDVSAIFAERLRRYAALSETSFPAAALRNDYRKFLDSHTAETGVVYADPPYTREHYSRFYHVLETMALGDSPTISTVTLGGRATLSRGLYREERHQSPFCIRTKAPAAFGELFAGVRALGAPLVLSYSPSGMGTAARPKPRLMTIPDLVDLAREHFDQVELRSLGRFRHSKFNARELNGKALEEAEVLLVCEP